MVKKCTKYEVPSTKYDRDTVEIPAAAGSLREIVWNTYLKLFHRACSVYFYGISTVFHFKTTNYLILKI